MIQFSWNCSPIKGKGVLLFLIWLHWVHIPGYCPHTMKFLRAETEKNKEGREERRKEWKDGRKEEWRKEKRKEGNKNINVVSFLEALSLTALSPLAYARGPLKRALCTSVVRSDFLISVISGCSGMGALEGKLKIKCHYIFS